MQNLPLSSVQQKKKKCLYTTIVYHHWQTKAEVLRPPSLPMHTCQSTARATGSQIPISSSVNHLAHLKNALCGEGQLFILAPKACTCCQVCWQTFPSFSPVSPGQFCSRWPQDRKEKVGSEARSHLSGMSVTRKPDCMLCHPAWALPHLVRTRRG